ncbi:MAG: cation:proton antiporter [Parachlamydiaceae bacterium]
MPDELSLIGILAIGLGLACLLGYICQRLKLPPILGYLLAGYFMGPNFPGYVADPYFSEQMANIGVTLLMFAVGLSFDWKELSSVKKVVIPGAFLVSIVSINAGIFLSIALKESFQAGLVIGLAICVSSTVVIVRVLADQNLLNTSQGHLVIGWTIVEDLISVLGLILLPTLVNTSLSGANPTMNIISSFGIVAMKLMALGLIVYFVGEKLIDRILKTVARIRSHELFTLAILASAFLVAVGSSYLFGVSIAIGAFIAGTVVGKTSMSHQAAANALPMRDAFAVIFFLSVGMLFNPMVVGSNFPLFFGVLAILLLLRPFLSFVFLKFLKYPTSTAFTVALAISQIGEYSFILAEEGSKLQILPDNAYDILVACAFISVAINPFLFQLFKPLLNQTTNTCPEEAHPAANLEGLSTSFLPRAVIIGFGPLGKIAAKSLQDLYDILIIDQNIDTIDTFKEKGMRALFGDATQLLILERAQLENVELVVITTPNALIAQHIIRIVQQINPHCQLIARTHFSKDAGQFGNIPLVCDEETAAAKMEEFIQAYLANRK